MIKIYDRLWFILRDDPESKLAYMCQYEETSTGNVSFSVQKMQSTGSSWARKDKSAGSIIDNKPTSGIYVGSSVSRWSTSNKLFKVDDPRGFTVEIPTDNLTTVLHRTTVIKGVIQEDCVWGRDGGSHILLPVDSEPYKLSKKNQNIIDNKIIPVNDLKVGDWVKFFGRERGLYFFGRVKITWKLRSHTKSTWYNKSIKEDSSDWYEIEDDKYTNIFLWAKPNKDGDYYTESPTKPKVVKVLRNEKIDVQPKNLLWLPSPKRVDDRLWEMVDSGNYSIVESEIVSVKHK